MNRFFNGCLFLSLTLLLCCWAAAQEKEPEDLLIDQEPYDLLTAVDGDMEETYRIFDLELSPRRVPAEPNPTTKFKFRLQSRPHDKFEIAWAHVKRLRFFEELVLEEANGLMEKKDFVTAYRFFSFLFKDYPNTSGLEDARLDFLFADGKQQQEKKNFDLALTIFEHLYELQNSYPGVIAEIGACADEVAKAYMDQKDYPSGREFLKGLEDRYGNRLMPPVVSKWRMHMINLAQEKMTEAKRFAREKDGRAAHRIAAEMLSIYPEVPGGRMLKYELEKAFPILFVAVNETARNPDPNSLHNVNDARVGKLTRTMVMEFKGQSFQGGEYKFLFGPNIEISEDELQLKIRVTQGRTETTNITGFDLAQRLLNMADPRTPQYLPSWARLVDQISVERVNTVVVDLRQRHMLPSAYMNMLLDDRPLPPGEEDGIYVTNVNNRSDDETSYIYNPRRSQQGPPKIELVEVASPDSQLAVQSLRRGELHMIDRVYPGDVARLERDPNIEVVPYALPTVHMLIPNRDNEFLDNLTFRRAIVYGINRKMILDDLLLRGREEPACQVISGPFPSQSVKSDAIGYGYKNIKPRPYELRLAATLVILAERQLEAMARELDKEPPKRPKLILAHPASETARIICQAIAQNLTGIGLEIELKQLPRGQTDDPTRKYDLLFVELSMWEPLTDIRKLVGPDGLTGLPGPYINLALRRLDQARTWTAARQRLYGLHDTVHHNLTVIPLWQLVNYYAYRKDDISNVGKELLSLYDNVDQWELILERP